MGESGSPLISFPVDGTSSCKVVTNSFTQHKFWTGKLSEWVKAPATKHDNLSPRTHMVEESQLHKAACCSPHTYLQCSTQEAKTVL